MLTSLTFPPDDSKHLYREEAVGKLDASDRVYGRSWGSQAILLAGDTLDCELERGFLSNARP